MAKAATKKGASKKDAPEQDAPKTAFYAKCGKGSRCKRLPDGSLQVIARDDFKSAKDGKHYHRECLPKGHEFVSTISLSPKAGKKVAKKAA